MYACSRCVCVHREYVLSPTAGLPCLPPTPRYVLQCFSGSVTVKEGQINPVPLSSFWANPTAVWGNSSHRVCSHSVFCL